MFGVFLSVLVSSFAVAAPAPIVQSGYYYSHSKKSCDLRLDVTADGMKVFTQGIGTQRGYETGECAPTNIVARVWNGRSFYSSNSGFKTYMTPVPEGLHLLGFYKGRQITDTVYRLVAATGAETPVCRAGESRLCEDNCNTQVCGPTGQWGGCTRMLCVPGN